MIFFNNPIELKHEEALRPDQTQKLVYELVEAHAVISRLDTAGYHGAVVGGGYLRDLALGINPKDMDVFVPYMGRVNNTKILELNISEVTGLEFKVQYDISPYSGMEVCRIFEEQPTDLPQSPPIQIIEMAPGINPAMRAAMHDFGLCQVWMGLSGETQCTEWFESDFVNKTCTLVECENEREHRRSMRRWERLSKKLIPLGFKLVDATPWAKDRDESI